MAGGCGFCVLNGAAAGAARARARGIARVAIVDFDVHHGNGTQQIVRERLNGRAGEGAGGADEGEGAGDGFAALYLSTHLRETFDARPDDAYFPGSGGVDDDYDCGCAPRREARFVCPIADDAERRGASPGGGSARRRGGGAVNVPLAPLWPAPAEAAAAPELTGRGGFRAGFEARLLPELRAFGPGLLIISAGFDGARGDEGSLAPDMETAGLDLRPDDFAWATRELVAAVGARCPVVSVLEGGYGRWDDEAGCYDRSGLAACAVAHVRGLQEAPD